MIKLLNSILCLSLFSILLISTSNADDEDTFPIYSCGEYSIIPRQYAPCFTDIVDGKFTKSCTENYDVVIFTGDINTTNSDRTLWDKEISSLSEDQKSAIFSSLNLNSDFDTKTDNLFLAFHSVTSTEPPVTHQFESIIPEVYWIQPSTQSKPQFVLKIITPSEEADLESIELDTPVNWDNPASLFDSFEPIAPETNQTAEEMSQLIECELSDIQ